MVAAARFIDLFAGLGGSSEAARQAGGRVLWAANHWDEAVELHKLNHPGADHKCQDLCQYPFHQTPDHDVLLASPACQGHTHAKGKERPHHDACRATAWAVPAAIDAKRPKVAIVENVPEFLSWEGYRGWRIALEDFGYNVTSCVLDAADFGVPQNRERVFIVASQVGAITLDDMVPHVSHIPASTFVNTNVSEGRWSLIEKPGRAEATLERIANGRERFGKVFLAPYYGSGSGKTGRDLDRPIGTISTVDGWSVINGKWMRMLTKEEYRIGMGFPSHYHLPRTKRPAVHMLGNAVCPPLMKEIIQHVCHKAALPLASSLQQAA